jgi:hypothetical protein
VQLPLFVITGASGGGKSAVALELVPILRGKAVVIEADILWGPEFAAPEDDYRRWREVWLRLAANIGQAGLPVVLAGTFLPHGFEPLPERRYFTAMHYLGLVAEEGDLVARLRARPAWRDSSKPDFIEAMIRLNRWLQENAATTVPPIRLLNTSELSRKQTVEQAAAWFRLHLAAMESCVPFPTKDQDPAASANECRR